MAITVGYRPARPASSVSAEVGAQELVQRLSYVSRPGHRQQGRGENRGRFVRAGDQPDPWSVRKPLHGTVRRWADAAAANPGTPSLVVKRLSVHVAVGHGCSALRLRRDF